MPKDDNEKIRRQVMKGIQDPKEHNPDHKARLKRDADRKVAVARGIVAKGKRNRRHDDGGVIDSGMFDS